MRNLPPAVRQKLAILLKQKAATQGGMLPPRGIMSSGNTPSAIAPSPTLASPPMPKPGIFTPKPAQGIQLNPGQTGQRFFSIKKKLAGQ